MKDLQRKVQEQEVTIEDLGNKLRAAMGESMNTRTPMQSKFKGTNFQQKQTQSNKKGNSYKIEEAPENMESTETGFVQNPKRQSSMTQSEGNRSSVSRLRDR